MLLSICRSLNAPPRVGEIKALEQPCPHERAVDSDYGRRRERDGCGGGLPLHGHFEAPEPALVRQVSRESEEAASAHRPEARVIVFLAPATAENGTRSSRIIRSDDFRSMPSSWIDPAPEYQLNL